MCRLLCCGLSDDNRYVLNVSLWICLCQKWKFSFKICLWSAASESLPHSVNEHESRWIMKPWCLCKPELLCSRNLSLYLCLFASADRDLYILHHCKGLSCKSFRVRSFLTAPRHPLNSIYRVISFMQTRVKDESQSLINYELPNTFSLLTVLCVELIHLPWLNMHTPVKYIRCSSISSGKVSEGEGLW